jgi:GntR family transcriptional regulator/MocR family aminotransferase
MRAAQDDCILARRHLRRTGTGSGAAAEKTRLTCTGYAQGIALLVGVLAAAGAKRLALEDPSSGDDALPAARAAGLEGIGVPVDRDGIRTDALRDTGADAVILTPSHQWPTGSVLSARNRAAVLRWAAVRGAVVIEDDYDAEYRYDRTPVGALQGLAPDRVVYAGSASKTLAPGLRLGWFVLPGHLAEPMAAAKIAADRGPPALEQSPGCHRTWTRPRSSTRPRAPEWASRA